MASVVEYAKMNSRPATSENLTVRGKGLGLGRFAGGGGPGGLDRLAYSSMVSQLCL